MAAQAQPYSDKYYVKSRGSTKLDYPSPWFDISRSYMPKSVKTLFKHCRTFFYRSGFINSVITKMTEYPITDLLFEKDTDVKIRKIYKKFFDYEIKIKSMLIQIGLDYFTFGNSFISANMKFDRYLKCQSCKTSIPIDEVKYQWRNFEFHGECPKCGSHGVYAVEDQYLNNPSYLKFVRWSPENIDLEYDPLTGDTTYYYNMPAVIKNKIIKGNKKALKTTPDLFFKALKEKKKIELDSNNLYHFKRNTLAEEDQGWGKPVILSALADIWYMQTLRRGNEAIAAEHIVPFRTLFPAPTGAIDPFSQMNLRTWRSKLEDDVRAWKQDPNHIGIFPIPIGSQNIGGDAKMLLVTAELKFLEETIINSLGVPLEFIKGGATWTGSSISLRIVENHFLTYRSQLEDFVNHFIIRKATELVKFPSVTVHFKRLRMADDSETKRLILELSATNKISLSKTLEEFGISFEEEKENIKMSKEFEISLAMDTAMKEAEAQGKALEIQAKYQVRAQQVAIDEQARIREAKFKDELTNETLGDPSETDLSSAIDKYAEEIMLLDPAGQIEALGKLETKMPYHAALVAKRVEEKLILQEMMIPEEPEEPATSAKPKPKTQTSKPANTKPDGTKDEGAKKKAGHPKAGPK
jgi:hypothetical protein